MRRFAVTQMLVWIIHKENDNNNDMAQKEYKNKHDWVGKVIAWELCKKLKFEQTNK